MKWFHSPTFLFMLLVLISPALARKWTDATGVFSVEAELVEVVDGNVRLKKSDGTIASVSLDKLSRVDQEFVQSLDENKAATKPSGRARVEAALAQETKFEFVATPIDDVLKYIADLHNIPVVLDTRSLDKVGIGKDSPVVANRRGKLARELDRILDPKGLTFLIQNEVLLITTKEAAESSLETRVYKLTKRIEADRLIEDVTKNIAPDSWNEVGGPGSLGFHAPSTVIVAQNYKTFQQLEKHYAELLNRVERSPSRLPTIPGQKLPGQSLMSEARLEYIETPLQDVVESLKGRHKVPILLDERALDAIGIGKDTPISMKLKGVRLSSALNLMLMPLNLTWTADESSITITTPEAAEGKLILAGYDAGELGDLESVREVILSTVMPTSWSEVGGPGSIRAGVRGTLDVRQTLEGHLKVSALLEELRLAKKK